MESPAQIQINIFWLFLTTVRRLPGQRYIQSSVVSCTIDVVTCSNTDQPILASINECITNVNTSVFRSYSWSLNNTCSHLLKYSKHISIFINVCNTPVNPLEHTNYNVDFCIKDVVNCSNTGQIIFDFNNECITLSTIRYI